MRITLGKPGRRVAVVPRQHPCCSCGEMRAIRWRNWREIQGYQLLQCAQCGLVSVDPIPPPQFLDEFYHTIYKVQLRSGLVFEDNKRIEWLEHFSVVPGRLLEIGSSWGAGSPSLPSIN